MDDEEVLASLTGDAAAQTKALRFLYSTYAKPFARYFQKHGVDRSEAEDLVQEVFLAVLRHANSFRHDCALRIWLWTIARNTMHSHFRKRRPELLGDAEEDVREGLWCGVKGTEPTLEDCVRQAFGKFRKDCLEYAEALFLAAIEGWSTDELAGFLGRTPGATREFISQCRKKLQPYVDPCKEYLS